MTDAMIIFCTCANQEEALVIADSLVRSRLAACVNLFPPLQSVYRWKGNIETAQEILLLVKTTQECFAAVRHRIKELHSYDTPEIIAIPVIEGSDKYLAWLREQCK